MRIFTAVPLPQDVKDKFTQISRGRLPVPYVSTTNFHITLNFLGELDTDQVKAVKDFWKQLPSYPKMDIEFDKLIIFNRQIHMTLKDNPALIKIQEDLKNEFMKMGYKPTFEKYYAHVKISNLHMDKVMYKDRKVENFPNEELKNLSFTADRIVLFESKLLLHHLHHIELDEHRLI